MAPYEVFTWLKSLIFPGPLQSLRPKFTHYILIEPSRYIGFFKVLQDHDKAYLTNKAIVHFKPHVSNQASTMVLFFWSCKVSGEKSGDKKTVESSTKFFQTEISNIDTGKSVF